MAGHTALAGQQGYTDEQIASLGAAPAGQELFDPAVRAALTYATFMTRDAHQVTDAFFAELKKHYTNGQIVELTSVVGLTNYWNRFTTALRIDLSGSDEAY